MDGSGAVAGAEGRAGETIRLFGRADECAVIGELLKQAHRSRSGVLVLRGEAGVGKSALLEFAGDNASGMRVLRAVGLEPECELAFAGLHGILRPVLYAIDEIPAVQAEALRSALSIGPGAIDNRFAIALAVLHLLSQVAVDGPLLCLIDDAQWLDQPSTDALAFVARRLEAEGIVMLFSARDGDQRAFAGSGLPQRTVTALDPADAEALLVHRFASALTPELRRVIVDAAQGNPLALLEIPGTLTSGQLAGREALPQPMPIGHELEGILLERVRRLSEPAQMLLLVAAAEGTGEAEVVMSACHVVGVAPSALVDVESAGLMRSEGAALEFRHPLLRSAVYRGASLPRRQAAHRALAVVLDGTVNADRRAWHRAALVLYPDDEIADELERTAERARRRSGHAAAGRTLRRAAELTSSDDRRARRLAAAARAAWDGGRPDEAVAMVRAAEPDADAVTHAELRHVQGEIEFRCGRQTEGAKLLMEGAAGVAGADPRKALQMLFDAAQCGNYCGDFGVMVEAGRKASELPIDESEPEAAYVELLAGMVPMLEADQSGYRQRLIRALDRVGADSNEPRWLVWAAAAAAGIGDQARSDSLVRNAETIARGSMAVAAVASVLDMQSWTALIHGRVIAASLRSQEGLQLATECGLTNSACWHRAILAWVTAVRGDERRCAAFAGQAIDTATANELATHDSLSNWAIGLLHLGLGQPEAAAARLEALSSTVNGTSHPYIVLRALPDLVEAAIHADRRDLAERAAAQFAASARAAALDWQLALAARCEALVAHQPDTKERLLVEALAYHDRDRRPFHQARTQLVFGEHLRRQRRRKDARVALHSALDTFEQLGATPWAERARRELRATGQTARRRSDRVSTELTLQERQVVEMVAEGDTNRDVAQQLFISPRTVEYHLRNVFSKLGITSRAELIRIRLDDRTSIKTD